MASLWQRFRCCSVHPEVADANRRAPRPEATSSCRCGNRPSIACVARVAANPGSRRRRPCVRSRRKVDFRRRMRARRSAAPPRRAAEPPRFVALRPLSRDSAAARRRPSSPQASLAGNGFRPRGGWASSICDALAKQEAASAFLIAPMPRRDESRRPMDHPSDRRDRRCGRWSWSSREWRLDCRGRKPRSARRRRGFGHRRRRDAVCSRSRFPCSPCCANSDAIRPPIPI